MFIDFRSMDVVIAAGIALVFSRARVAAGDNVHSAVGARGGMHGNPHADASGWIGLVPIRIVLMPVGPGSVSTRLEKNLIEHVEDWPSNQRLDGVSDRWCRAQSGDERTVRGTRTQLQIGDAGRDRLAIPVSGDVREFTGGLQTLDLGLQGGDLQAREKVGNGDPPFAVKVGDLIGREWHRQVPALIIEPRTMCRRAEPEYSVAETEWRPQLVLRSLPTIGGKEGIRPKSGRRAAYLATEHPGEFMAAAIAE